MRKHIIALAFLLISVIVLSASAVSAADGKFSFTDVKEKKWYYNVVKEMYDKGIMKGKTDTAFGPEDKMTRAEFVTILARLSGDNTKDAGKTLKFKDTKTNQWYSDYVGWAVKNGLVDGYAEDNTFRVNNGVNRMELAKLIVKYLEYKQVTLENDPLVDGFADKGKIQSWAVEFAEKLRLTGLVGGDNNGNFNPKNGATRAEIANIISRFLEKTADKMHSALKNWKTDFANEKGYLNISLGTTRFLDQEHFDEAFLSAIGLDSKTYTAVTTPGFIEDEIKSGFANIGFNEHYMTISSIRIKNRVTGEQTDKVRVNLDIEKVYLEYFIDPTEFVSGIDEDIYADMKEAALYRIGDMTRMRLVVDKAEGGERIKVAYLGGSITQGAGADIYSCYAQLTFNYLKTLYPQMDVADYINAGVGGTTSEYGCQRYVKDVLSKKPDIIFIEFCVNDEGMTSLRETYESLVRRALECDWHPAVFLLFAAEASKNPDFGDNLYRKALAEYYDVPVIDVSSSIQLGRSRGAYEFSEFAPDNVHPNEWGYSIMTDMIDYFMDKAIEKAKALTDGETAITPVADKPFIESGLLRMTDIGAYPAGEIKADSEGSWTLETVSDDSCFVHSSPNGENEPLKFSFDGAVLYIKWKGSAGYGTAEVYVDGVKTAELDGTNETEGPAKTAYLGTYGHHVVEIKMVPGSEKSRFVLEWLSY